MRTQFSLRPIGDYRVEDIEGPTVFVGGAMYRSPPLSEMNVEDLAGDREGGLNTLPIAIGERPALTMATAVLLVAVVASPVPYVLGTFGVTVVGCENAEKTKNVDALDET